MFEIIGKITVGFVVSTIKLMLLIPTTPALLLE